MQAAESKMRVLFQRSPRLRWINLLDFFIHDLKNSGKDINISVVVLQKYTHAHFFSLCGFALK